MPFNLELQNSFQFENGDGISFDPSTKNLFVGRSAVVLPQQFLIDWSIGQFTPNGQLISSITSNRAFSVSGVAFLPNGNLVITSPAEGRVVEFTKSGQLATGGIDFTSSELQVTQGRLAEDVIYNARTGTLFVVEARRKVVYEFDARGNIRSTLDLSTKLGDAPLKGINIDPISGNFLLVTDNVGNSNSDNRIFELTPAGDVVSSIDLEALTGIADSEGVAIDATTHSLYIVFDTDNARGLTEYAPNRNQVASFKIQYDTFAGDTGSNDTRTGDAAANTFLGGLGNDNLLGAAGEDILDGGAGDDTINGNQDNDQVFGGTGNDFARGGSGNDFVSGGVGDDTLFGDAGNDTVTGTTGSDIINGNAGNDSLLGGEGNDIVRGGRGEDILSGDRGNDTLIGDFGNDTINGGEGNDSLLGQFEVQTFSTAA